MGQIENYKHVCKITFMGKFRNIFFGIVLFLTFFNLHAHSEVVNKVRIEGNERISSETIVIFGDILIGKDYDKSDISLLIKKSFRIFIIKKSKSLK